MARIAGINLPTNKRVVIALTYIHGIGNTASKEICKAIGIADSKRVNEISDSEVMQIREHIDANFCLLYTSPSPRDVEESRMPSSA